MLSAPSDSQRSANALTKSGKHSKYCRAPGYIQRAAGSSAKAFTKVLMALDACAAGFASKSLVVMGTIALVIASIFRDLTSPGDGSKGEPESSTSL